MEPIILADYSAVELPRERDYALHAHDYNEILLFLTGDADYSVEGHRYRLHRGDLMLMRKSEAHHLIVRSGARYERLCVHFSEDCLEKIDPEKTLLRMFRDRPLGKFNQYRAARFPDSSWRYYMEKIVEAPDHLGKLCYLLPLLRELSGCFAELKAAEEEPQTDRAAEVMRYISNHLEEPLSLRQLAEQFHYSQTYLNEQFRQSVGTTVWQYIVTKRVLVARERLRAGVAPTRVCQECGFQDYSTFYRAYRQHMGVSPREDSIK